MVSIVPAMQPHADVQPNAYYIASITVHARDAWRYAVFTAFRERFDLTTGWHAERITAQ
jgi:hypothetical protein